MADLGEQVLSVLAVCATLAAMGGAILLLVLDMPLAGGPSTLARVVAWLRLARAPLWPSLVAGLAAMALGPLLMAPTQFAPLTASLAGLIALLFTALRLLPYSRLQRSLSLLERGELETQAVAGILAALERIRPRASERTPHRSAYPDLVLLASSRLIAARHFAAAARLSSELPELWLSPSQSNLRANNLALCRIRMGDLGGAREALELARMPERSAEARILTSTRAMLLALEGRAEEALALSDDPRNLDQQTKLTLLVARAHACVALEQSERARDALRTIVRDFGVAALDALLQPLGPASPLARQMRQDLETHLDAPRSSP